ncbi:LXG domain-containing protein, partial [Streptococcus suis]|nr:LXG domain-containing protein [Streptococcus suis]
MVKVNLVSMNTHISSVKAISGQRIASLQQVISSLDQFYSAGSLQGQAYTNAKDFGQDVLRSLAQGLILYSEELSQSASQLGSLYKSIVGNESLDESVLRANIASYQASLAHQSYIYNRLMGEDILNF